MISVTLIREQACDQGTAGRLYVDGILLCHTLELPWRNNQSNISRVPGGAYPLIPFQSRRFGSVYLLQDTLPRTYVLTHAGNYAGDSSLGYRTDSHGCILLGRKKGMLGNQKAVLSSRAAVRDFISAMNGDNSVLTIIDQGF